MKNKKWGLIILGLVIFIVGVTFPFWYGGGKKSEPPRLDLDTPAIAQLPNKKCVEDKTFMRTSHMKLLGEWRDQAVRQGNHRYIAKNGKTYEIGLTNTCLKCHSNKEQFCDRCHNYLGAKPACWSCHVVPEEVK
ncbi:MAG: sulfate reduction electron transfer complex DsrMKJOP subunit DsrJ [Deltaproteobacteria bacterium]